KTVRGLVRGLSLLQLLNKANGGVKIQELSELSGLHRTTVRRLLETLIGEGYVRKSISDDSYLLAIKVRELSDGFRDEQWISQIAAPLLGTLMQDVVWPTDICTFDGDSMVVRETTHRFSRLSFHRNMVGRRLPMLMTATGKAYLAYCSENERTQILELLKSRDDEQAEYARNDDYVRRVLRVTRENGYGSNYGEWGEEGRIAAVARPIMNKGRVMGCLNLVYIAEAMTIEKAAEKHLGSMIETITKIEARF
ncbi:MAG: DNA-binding transcriptional regulator, partial [Pontibacterium sp.]